MEVMYRYATYKTILLNAQLTLGLALTSEAPVPLDLLDSLDAAIQQAKQTIEERGKVSRRDMCAISESLRPIDAWLGRAA